MLVFACKVHHLRHFCFRHLVRVNSALANSVVVDMQHDPGSGFAILVEKALKDVNDEFHWRVVVVEEQDTVQVWPLGLGLGFGNNSRPGATLIALALSVVVGKAWSKASVLKCASRLPV
jgi:hypothetical protein